MDNSQELAATAKKNLAWVHRRTWEPRAKDKIAEAYHCIAISFYLDTKPSKTTLNESKGNNRENPQY